VLCRAAIRAASAFLAVFLSLAGVLLPGLGSRHLWVDEVETAERARSVLETGLPRVIDGAGNPSLAAGGRELEEGNLHRYTPWLQFYAAAGGLAVARQIGASPDLGVRLAFALSHAGAAGALAAGLVRFGGLAPLPAAALAGSYGLGSVRLLHDRSARYHALLELSTALGLLALGALRQSRAGAGLGLAAILLALPHVHTLGGGLLDLVLAGGALHVLRARGGPWLGRTAWLVALPGAASLLALLALTRPWGGGWYHWRLPPFWSLRDLQGIAFPLWVWSASALFAWRHGAVSGRTALLGAGMAALLLVLLDCNSISQPRYYLALSAPAFFWPLALGLEGLSARAQRGLWAGLFAALGVAELAIGPLSPPLPAKAHIRHQHAPLQGLRLALHDTRPLRQPLSEALDAIRAGAGPVLIDYVPPLANWYLPGRPVALMPDPTFQRPRNRANPLWSRPRSWPAWHLWYPHLGSGLWSCRPDCDFDVAALDLERGEYDLFSRSLGRRERFCVVQTWPTNRWNNAPFMNLRRSAFRPAGRAREPLVLARPCASLASPRLPASPASPAGA
jgi:hypothetical protein